MDTGSSGLVCINTLPANNAFVMSKYDDQSLVHVSILGVKVIVQGQTHILNFTLSNIYGALKISCVPHLLEDGKWKSPPI